MKWEPRNGKQIWIWEDNFGQFTPARNKDAYKDLKHWIDAHNIFTVYNISDSQNNGSWEGWKNLEIAENINMDYLALKLTLQGSDSIHLNISDSRKWGKSGTYSVKASYSTIHKNNKK